MYMYTLSRWAPMARRGGQDSSQHPKNIYPLDSGDEGLTWILNQVGPISGEYDFFSFARLYFEVVFSCS